MTNIYYNRYIMKLKQTEQFAVNDYTIDLAMLYQN